MCGHLFFRELWLKIYMKLYFIYYFKVGPTKFFFAWGRLPTVGMIGNFGNDIAFLETFLQKNYCWACLTLFALSWCRHETNAGQCNTLSLFWFGTLGHWLCSNCMLDDNIRQVSNIFEETNISDRHKTKLHWRKWYFTKLFLGR